MSYEHVEVYRAFLQDELAGRAKMNNRQLESILHGFDKLALVASPDTSFKIMHEAYAATDTDKALNTVRAIIQQALDKANKECKGIDRNPVSRLRALIERFNKNLEKCAVEINGVPLSKEEIEKERIKIPGHYPQPKNHVTYTATASRRNGKTVKLTLEIKQ